MVYGHSHYSVAINAVLIGSTLDGSVALVVILRCAMPRQDAHPPRGQWRRILSGVRISLAFLIVAVAMLAPFSWHICSQELANTGEQAVVLVCRPPGTAVLDRFYLVAAGLLWPEISRILEKWDVQWLGNSIRRRRPKDEK